MCTAIRTISLKASLRRSQYNEPPPALKSIWKFHEASTDLLSGLHVDEKLSQQIIGRQLRLGEIGCYSSHLSLWRELISNPSLEQLIILEDDVYVDWLLLSQLREISWSKLGVHYLKLFPKYPASFRIVSWDYPIKDRHIVQYTSLALGTGGYILTKHGARLLEAKSRNICRPIDVQMDRAWSNNLPVFGITPVVGIELSLPSSIEDRELHRSKTYRSFRYLNGRIREHAHARMYKYFSAKIKLDRSRPVPKFDQN